MNIRVVQKTFFLKSNATNGFPRCITPKNDIDQFSQNNFVIEGVRISILVYDVIYKSEKKFFGKYWQVAYQPTQNDPMSHNFLIVVVY